MKTVIFNPLCAVSKYSYRSVSTASLPLTTIVIISNYINTYFINDRYAIFIIYIYFHFAKSTNTINNNLKYLVSFNIFFYHFCRNFRRK